MSCHHVWTLWRKVTSVNGSQSRVCVTCGHSEMYLGMNNWEDCGWYGMDRAPRDYPVLIRGPELDPVIGKVHQDSNGEWFGWLYIDTGFAYLTVDIPRDRKITAWRPIH